MKKPDSVRRIEPRICIGCAADMGVEGPMSWSADVHLLPDGELAVSCSPSCRLKLGLKERKGGGNV